MADQKREHLPALDGVRGLAILLVLAVHFFMPLQEGGVGDALVLAIARSGWVGVDLFFVLSGYLITGILIESRGSPAYYSRFYARRAFRIFPLYYAFLLTMRFVAGPALVVVQHHYPSVLTADQSLELTRFQANEWWYFAYLSNVGVALHGGAATFALWTAPFWSLAIEEQFYLVWPAVVRRVSLRPLLLVALSGAAAAVLGRALVWWFVPDRLRGAEVAYMLTPFRLDGLAFGAAIAVLIRTHRHVLARLVRPVGSSALLVVLILAVARAGYDRYDPWVRNIGYLANSLVSAALVAWSITSGQESLINRALSWRPLRTLGLYAYGLYVIQIPVMAVAQRLYMRVHLQGPTWLVAIPSFLVVVFLLTGLAWVVYQVVERPFLSLKRFFPTSQEAGQRVVLAGDRLADFPTAPTTANLT